MKKYLASGLPAGIFAVGLILWGTGLLSRESALALAGRTLPILLFVLAMTVVTELADNAGLFNFLTSRLARWGTPRVPGPVGTGRIMILWLLVVALATLSTVFLSLDTTAVLVTPLVVQLARHARIPPLAFALTTAWLANTASMFLPVSNLTNLLAQHQLDTTPLGFFGLLWAPALVGVVVPLAFLALIFRKDLRGRYQSPPAHQVRDRALLWISAVTLALLLPALVTGIPVAIPASIAAAFLLLVFLIRRRSAVKWAMVPVQPLLLTLGLFLVVATLHDHGLGTALARVAGSGDSLPSLLQLATAGAVSANTINNLPAYLALETQADSSVRLAALLIGVNLGPLISPWASLATLLWHARLKSMGITISWSRFVLAGLCLVVVLIPAAVLALWLSAGMPS